ncbi:GNAT family N-acetyltransferase [Halostella sp. JP-L12]|uniref:GNAT family N-acetyltransferase n=1 Tax=Halostella TaxID=1843185 RepID=UPI000EF7847C|nr:MULTISPECIES: GNAT family N-acetyltransferase [Halostella]NHN48912.1 GNAT family N-acetyltransferase [Halostella sp. JP-L12]
MDVERPTTDDLDAIVEQWVALATEQRAHGSHLAAEGNREAVRETVARAIVTDCARVARDDGDLLGFVTFEPGSSSYEQDVRRGHVQNLYVRPDARGAGVGAALLDAAERALASAGADVVSLEALADNAAARRFYRREGYDVHRVTMEKSLADESDNHSKGDR